MTLAISARSSPPPMQVSRPPLPALRPYVAMLWATDDLPPGTKPQAATEHMLPTGMMHMVFRMTDLPLRVRASAQDPGMLLGGAMVSGVRSCYFIRETSAPSCSVAAVLRPGAAQWLFGVGAGELAERHTPMEALWGATAVELRERLQEASGAAERLALLETALVARLHRVPTMHPAMAAVLNRLDAGVPVHALVADSGLSHRRFIAQFRHSYGLTPKVYQRILRFQGALASLRDGHAPLAAVATSAGYSDQAHFNREFAGFSGLTPVAYRQLRPANANHVPVNFLQDRPVRI